jgi:hypothetical protein
MRRIWRRCIVDVSANVISKMGEDVANRWNRGCVCLIEMEQMCWDG